MPSRTLQLAFSTLGLPASGWADVVALARKFGFSAVELRALRGSVDLPASLRQEFGSPAGLARAQEDAGIRVVSLDGSARLCGAEAGGRAEIAELAAWAQGAGIPQVRVFDGGEVASAAHPAVRAEMLRELEAWEALKAKEGLSCRLVVETHWALVQPEDIVTFGREAGELFHLLWDVGHTWQSSRLSPGETWPLLRPWVRHIHLKDLRRDGDAVRDVLPGEGEIDGPSLMTRLEEDGYCGVVSFEWEKFWRPELPELAVALDQGRRCGWW